MPGGQFLLPRDYDLDVVNAVGFVGGAAQGPAGFPLVPQFRSGSGPGNIVPPSRVVIIRKVPGGGIIKIHVDLHKAFTDPRERIIIQPEDTVLLLWKPQEFWANIGLNLVQFNLPLAN